MKKEFKIIKVKITQDMIGKDCFISDSQDMLKKCDYGVLNACTIDFKIHPRSLDQHRLLFAAFKAVAENKADDNNFNTVEKVKEQAKVHAKYFDCYYYFENEKTGEKQLNIKTKSISFSELEHFEACGLFDIFFDYCAVLLGLTKDELIGNIKEKDKLRKICVICGKKATQRHHKFANTKVNMAKYGKLLNEDFNFLDVCHDCHASHANPELCRDYIWTERKFIEELEKNNKK